MIELTILSGKKVRVYVYCAFPVLWRNSFRKGVYPWHTKVMCAMSREYLRYSILGRNTFQMKATLTFYTANNAFHQSLHGTPSCNFSSRRKKCGKNNTTVISMTIIKNGNVFETWICFEKFASFKYYLRMLFTFLCI